MRPLRHLRLSLHGSLLLLLGLAIPSVALADMPATRVAFGAAAPMQMQQRARVRPIIAPPPPPPTPDGRARLLFEEGTRHFTASRYADALAAFEAAYAISPRPELLYNIAICYERLQQPGQAAQRLRQYLASGLSGPMRVQIERRAAELEAQARVQGADEVEGELARPEDVDPEGMAPPEIFLDEPEVVPDSAPTAAPSSSRGRFGFALAGYVLAIAGGITTAAFGALSLADDDPMADACSLLDPCSPATLGLDVGLGILGAGLIWGTTALVLAIVGVDPLREGGQATLSPWLLVPWLSPEGGGVAIPGRF